MLVMHSNAKSAQKLCSDRSFDPSSVDAFSTAKQVHKRGFHAIVSLVFAVAIVLMVILPITGCSMVRPDGINGTWKQGTATLIVSPDGTWESTGTLAGHCTGAFTETSKDVYKFIITDTGAQMQLTLSADGKTMVANQPAWNGFIGGSWTRS